MILTCPACATHYKVDGAVFGNAPRLVRCANCGAQWTQHPGVEPEVEAVIPAEPRTATAAVGSKPMGKPAAKAMAAAPPAAEAPTAQSHPPQDPQFDNRDDLIPSRHRRRGNRLMVAFLLLCGLGLGAAGSYAFAPQLTAAVPQVAPAVNLLVTQVDRLRGRATEVIAGLAPKTRELVIVDAEHDFQDTANGPAIIVYGHIANNSTKPLPAPKITITLKDGKDTPLFAWDVQVEGQEVNGTKGLVSAGGSVRFWARSMFPPETTEKVTVRLKD